ncbi:MAG: adenylate/guanylate cyclase domain-containing protein [Acidimicrobiia bacterium]|nr:adenylate/guanylate cyclase domain-containing protein [Acidimicrobiia bacterium]NNF10485.1 adenylate/guanylate cyclase domain-containing protein [Acidimicrobiia bacterium]NNL70860.1 adenylate/guanylate cyclase domain-containing protein [Acidimicrobiia bacterium]
MLRFLEGVRQRLLSVGRRPTESDAAQGVRRIVVGSLWFSALGIPVSSTFQWLDGMPWLAAVGYGQSITALLLLAGVALRPGWLVAWIVTMQGAFGVAEVTEAHLRGGLIPSGLAALWGILGVLIALIALNLRWAVFWFVVLVAQIVYAAAITDTFEPLYPNADPTVDAAVTLILIGGVTFAVLAYFVRQRDHFQEQSDRLLRNVLPDEIAVRLKRGDGAIADRFDHVTVLFADVVGFTPLSSRVAPDDLVRMLSDLFSDLDDIVGQLGLEKIKTVGDEYMVAAGVPTPRPDHAAAVAEFGLRVHELVGSREYGGHRLEFRMGIHSGPVVAGVIGQRKFSYDLWGDTVNTASRLESHGTPGAIQISDETRRLIEESFVCEPRGEIELKGRGALHTWFVVGRR